MSGVNPDASVIVPAYRAVSTVGHCLTALARQNTNRGLEIIIVDDGSDDGTAESVEELIHSRYSALSDRRTLRLLRQAHRGPAAARNLGAREARGPIILFTDADCEPEPDWLENMILSFQDPSVCGTKGTYVTRQRGWVARLVQVEYEEKYERMKRFSTIDFIDTYSAAFRRDVFLSLGGFDESFPSASVEDQELSFRFAERGYQMRFVPGARVVHRHVTTLRDYARKKFRIAFYKSYLLVRHPKRVTGDTHTPPTLVMQIPLTYLLIVFICSAGFWGWAWPAAAIAAMADLGCMAATLAVCRQVDPALLPLVPLLLVVRSLALGAGLVAGTIRFRLLEMPVVRRHEARS